ncbi:nitronate monooxygenase [Sinanaerobacter chloroacetimidivorans]|jgi:nitronate monooxygenase|uniref:Probable nitronate monooxygenase n=1 Tax=Sinanaerobacter chloroacetimidivorans TaxID=2818044 RepID=A0A8J8B336_9FIRM|nr:nitronate monooxygenase [Sinanaerobacter chloroacetimidivorans]MBR0597910.1 nitronate monooxygenase [Sinanaerobacter chloroacetimidivorans]
MELTKKLNEILVSLFNSVLKMEEDAIKESSRHNLSITEVHTLAAIGAGKAKTMTQVAASLKISVSTLTVAINKLVDKKYVNRFRVPEDRRIVKIELTQEGIEAVQEHEDFHNAMVGDAIAALNEEELKLLVQSLDNINEFFKTQRLKPIRSDEPLKLVPLMLGQLEIPVPIFQGGMGIGVSLSRLAAAVAKCGGVGVISTAQSGYLEPDFATNTKEANLRALKKYIKEAINEIKDVPRKGIIAVNVMCAARHYEETVETAIEAGAQMIISGAGLPTSLPGICKGSKVKLVPIVSSARATALILKSWAKKYNRVPDAVIFEGPMAGGHLGFKEEQLEDAQEKFYQSIMEIKAELQDLPNCPLIVGGGIYTKEDVQKALSYGADGVQLGTRFVTTEECDVHPKFKEAYLKAKKEDMVVIKSPVGMPGRAIATPFTKKVEQGRIPPERCNGCLIPCKADVAPYCITDALIRAAKGDVENGLVFSGSNAYRAEKIEKVEDIFRELTS